MAFIGSTVAYPLGTPAPADRVPYIDDSTGELKQALVPDLGGSALLRTQAVAVDATYGDDATGALNNLGRPFLTINAALDALIASGAPGTVFLSRGRFAPIHDDYQGSTTPDPASKLFSGLSIIGSGKPRPNSKTAPTTLLDTTGTVIDGPLLFDSSRNNITIRDLGVDSGSAVCTARYSGVAQETCSVANIPQSTARLATGWQISNICCLAQSATAAVHGCLMEDLWEPQGDSIDAYFGTHGFVDKSYRGRWSNILSKGHATDCFGFSYNSYAHSYQPVMSNLVCGELAASDTPTGLWFITTTSGNMSDIVINGVQCIGILTQEILFAEFSTGSTSRVRINGLQTSNGVIRTTTATNTNKSSIFVNGDALDGTVPLTDAASIATDASLGKVFSVTLGGNRTLANPTNLQGGQTYLWRVKQDGTGTRTLAYGSKFKWPASTAPVLSTAANSVDVITGVYDATSDTIAAVANKAFG
jgi:hypothetical protein